MDYEKSTAARGWAGWVLNPETGCRSIAKQFNEQVNLYEAPNKSKAFKENREKYRYFNVGCFDSNRIVLKDRPAHNDFYHANSVFLKGDEQFHVIAAQGPLYNTVDDFWELVYQEKVSTIVQLCNFTEDYWPKKNHRTFGAFKVSLEMEGLINENIPEIQLRTFIVKKEGGSEAHTVRHIFYSKWPDYGVPTTVAPLVVIIRWLEENGGMGMDSPLLVHCLAGIGRTGTAIITLMGLRHFRRPECVEDSSNVMVELAKELRRHRDGSIQTPQQFVYAHAAVLKLLTLEGLIEESDLVKNFRYVNHAF